MSKLIPSYRQLLLYEIKKSSIILSFDPFAFELKPFYWPVEEDKRVEPSRLLEYREQHHFRTPLCLCPLLQTLSEGPTITETAILEKRSGTHVAEHVAECASGHCGYFVSLDQAYGTCGIPVKKYPSKATKNISLPSIIAWPDIEQSRCHRPLKRTYAVADLTDPDSDSITIPRQTKWKKFDKIGRLRKPGLSEEEFWGLFAKCDMCQAITTRDVFRHHLEACQGETAAEDTVTDSDSEEQSDFPSAWILHLSESVTPRGLNLKQPIETTTGNALRRWHSRSGS